MKKATEKALLAHPCSACDVCCSAAPLAREKFMRPEEAPCPARREGGSGCTQYNSRPESCRAFNCVWRVGLLDETSLKGALGRPDKLGIMFDVKDTHATGIQLIVAQEIRKGAIEEHMPLLHELAGQGHVLYLVEGTRRRMMGPEERVHAVKAAAQRNLPLVSR